MMLLWSAFLFHLTLALSIKSSKLSLNERQITQSSNVISLTSTDVLTFHATVDGSPHQAMLLFTSKDADWSTLLKVRKGAKLRYHLDLSKPPSQLLSTFSEGDQVSLFLVLGSFKPSEDASVTPIATLTLPRPHVIKENIPTEWEIEKYAPLPELWWTFQQPVKGVWTITSVFWTLSVLSPWALLATFTSALKLQYRKQDPKVLAFLVSLVSVEVSIFLYWTSLNLFQASPLFALTAIFTLLTGKSALSHLKKQREAAQKYYK